MATSELASMASTMVAMCPSTSMRCAQPALDPRLRLSAALRACCDSKLADCVLLLPLLLLGNMLLWR